MLIVVKDKNISKIEDYVKNNNLFLEKVYDDKTYYINGNLDFSSFDNVEVFNIDTPYNLVSREFKKDNLEIKINDTLTIGKGLVFMAGPCAIEGKESLLSIAKEVKEVGAQVIRGGSFKFRTSPYSFQGLGKEALDIIDDIKKEIKLPFISEITRIEEIDEFVKTVDIIQVGARNMQNNELLKELGKINKPILLKRGMSATIEEWLMAAEYIVKEGNHNVILCERGIRTFEKYTRNSLDLSSIAVLKRLTYLPIIVDPSHATGNYHYVKDMALASIAAGADGLIIEVHNDFKNCMSDKDQAIDSKTLKEIIDKSIKIKEII